MSNEEKEYKFTQRLLKIAKQEGGYTNEMIALKAGLKASSTSLVSRWLNGKALAKERQMRYFINNYEHFLRRKMEHLFRVPQSEDNPWGLLKVTGDIIFKHYMRFKHNSLNKMTSLVRVVIIKNQNEFTTLLQNRIRVGDDLIISDNEDALWSTCTREENSTFSESANYFFKIASYLEVFDNLNVLLPGNYEVPSNMKAHHIDPMVFKWVQMVMKQGLERSHVQKKR